MTEAKPHKTHMPPFGHIPGAPRSALQQRLELLADEKRQAAHEKYVAKLKSLESTDKREHIDDIDAVALADLARDAGFGLESIDGHLVAVRDMYQLKRHLEAAREVDLTPLYAEASEARETGRERLLDIAKTMFDSPSVNELTIAQQILRVSELLPWRPQIDVKPAVERIRDADSAVDGARYAPSMFSEQIGALRRQFPEIFKNE
jgi:hypothetical protein